MSLGEIVAAGAARKISTALDAAMESPSKEIGNYIADKIRLLRYNSLLKIVQKAEAKAKERGMHLKMPAVKFFVPFCEAASLETADENEDLRDIWANLLVGATDREDAESLLYLRILQQIGTREVSFLRSLIEDGGATTWAMMVSSYHAEDADQFDEGGLRALISALPQDFDVSYVAQLVVDCGECPGLLFDEVCVLGEYKGDVDEVSGAIDHEVAKSRVAPANILISLGLVERLRIKNLLLERWDPSYALTTIGYRITLTGVGFYKACSGVNFQKVFKRQLDYKDYETGFRDWLRGQVESACY